MQCGVVSYFGFNPNTEGVGCLQGIDNVQIMGERFGEILPGMRCRIGATCSTRQGQIEIYQTINYDNAQSHLGSNHVSAQPRAGPAAEQSNIVRCGSQNVRVLRHLTSDSGTQPFKMKQDFRMLSSVLRT